MRSTLKRKVDLILGMGVLFESFRLEFFEVFLETNKQKR